MRDLKDQLEEAESAKLNAQKARKKAEAEVAELTAQVKQYKDKVETFKQALQMQKSKTALLDDDEEA